MLLFSVRIPFHGWASQYLKGHDFVGRDVHFEPDLGKIHLPYVKELLDSASGKDADGNPLVTLADLSSMLSKRRAESRATNPEFSLSKGQDELFSPAKYVPPPILILAD